MQNSEGLYENESTDDKFLESFKSIKKSDFEINFSNNFCENKLSNNVPIEKVQKTLQFQSKPDPKSDTSTFSQENQEQNFEKKRNSFNYIKKWDDYGKQLNSIYRNLIDRIMNFLLGVGTNSLDSYNNLLKFLKEKSVQEKIFSSIGNNPDVMRHKNCEIANALQEMIALEAIQQKEHFSFSIFIAKDLIQDILNPNQIKYQSYFDQYRKLENKMRSNLNKMIMIRKEKFEEYACAFAETMRLHLSTSKVLSKDLLTFENMFLYAVVENHNLLKFFSEEMKEFWAGLKRIEFERMKLFSTIISKFMQREEKLYKATSFYQEQSKNIRSILENINPEKQIEGLFDLNKILTSEQTQYLRQKHKIENFTEEVVFGYLDNFEIRPLKKSENILGEMKALEKDENNANKYSLKNNSLWKMIKLVVSIDLNMLVMGDCDDLSFKPTKIIRLPLSTCVYNEELLLATISEAKATALGMNNAEKHYFKFTELGELKKFMEFINRYIRKI